MEKFLNEAMVYGKHILLKQKTFYSHEFFKSFFYCKLALDV